MANGRLLISEDDPVLATMFLQLLGDQGYEVAVAYSPEEAVNVARTFQPQVVLIGNDGRGTFEPGWETAEALSRLMPGTPLIMLSTLDAAVEEVGVTERGRLFRAGFLKPFPFEPFITLIQRLCEAEVAQATGALVGFASGAG
jgi:DNA-binding response OmpR family regulator